MESIKLESIDCPICGFAKPGKEISRGLDSEYFTSSQAFCFVACENCNHVYLNPRPVIDSAPQIYPSDYYTMKANSKPNLVEKLKQIILLKRVSNLLKRIPQEGRVLEIGCGNGELLVAMKKFRADLHVTGLDLQFSQETKNWLHSNGVSLIEGPLEGTTLGGPFDLVIMNQLIEHLWDLRGSMAKVSASLKIGGWMSISTPNLDGYDRKFFSQQHWGGYYYPRHLHLFSSQSLHRFLVQFNLKTIEKRDLVAPLVWKGSLKSLTWARGWRIHRFFHDTNPLILAVFTTIDLIARALGLSTSNQQVIVTKDAFSQEENSSKLVPVSTLTKPSSWKLQFKGLTEKTSQIASHLPQEHFKHFVKNYILTLIPMTVALIALGLNPQWSSLYILVAIVIGFTQNALGILMHEGSHFFFHPQRQINDRIANFFVCLPIFNTVAGYRQQHFLHHRHFSEEKDPFFHLYGEIIGPRRLLTCCLRDLLGVTAVTAFLGRNTSSDKVGFTKSQLFGFFSIQLFLFLGFYFLTGKILAYFLLWVLPLMTIPFLVNRIRTLVEHRPMQDPLVNGRWPARSTFANFLERCLIGPYGYHNHFIHHVNMAIPYYQLESIHKQLASEGVKLSQDEVSPCGFLKSLLLILRTGRFD